MSRLFPHGQNTSAAATALALLTTFAFTLAPARAAGTQPSPGLPPLGPAPAPVFAATEEHESEHDAPNAERETETEFFRALAGREWAPDEWRRMWDAVLARPSEAPVTQAAGAARDGAPTRAEAVNTWQLVGPAFSTNVGGGLVTGRVRDLDPVNVRALAATGGLWRFNIFTAIAMSDSVPASWFGSFASNPSDANLILLGTGEYGQGQGTGLYRTTNGGATWTRVYATSNAVSRVRWVGNTTTAFAASAGGVLRSTNSGVTWTQVAAGFATDLVVVPEVPGLVFVTLAGSGIWRSIDGGTTWAILGGGAPAGPSLGNGAITAQYNPTLGQTWLYAAFDTKIWRSTNGGNTWTEVTPAFAVSNSGYGPAISICPNDGNTVLYGNVGYMRSTDGGATWTKLASAHLHADYHVFGWDTNGDGVWAGHDGGWSHSLDRGHTWSSSSNVMPVSQFYDVDCTHDGVGTFIGGTQDNNVLYTNTNSLAWIDPAVNSTEGDATGVSLDAYDPARMWAVSGVLGGPLLFARMRSTDGGTTWTNVSTGISSLSWSDRIVTDNAFPAKLYTSADTRVYESLDGGASWTNLTTTALPAQIRRLRASTRTGGGAVLWAAVDGVAGQQLYVRDNGTWYERSAGLVGKPLEAVPHPWSANASEAWAFTNSVTQQLWYTTNRGATWTDVSGDLPNGLMLTGMVPNPRHTNEWYVGSTVGMWRTTNGGVNWVRWNNGMPPGAIISDLTYQDQTTTTGAFYVVAGTYGRSVWKRDVAGDDPMPTVHVSGPFLEEGDSGTHSALFRADLSGALLDVATLSYATVDGTATAGSDYTATNGVLTFLPGQTTTYFIVPVTGDKEIENDETFTVTFSNALRVTLPSAITATIADDDAGDLVCHDLYVLNGPVNAIATVGNTVYVGGSFTSAGPSTGHGVPLDGATGLPLNLPRVDGGVYAAAPDGAGGWYIGGLFSHVAGIPRANLAHLFADGSLDAVWNPGTNGFVEALVLSGNSLYVGGEFTEMGGVLRSRAAAIDVTTLAIGSWAPEPDAPVYTFARSGNTLYVGGRFTTFGGQARGRGAAVSLLDGSLSAWNPAANGDIASLAADAGTVWAAGSFTSIGGQNRNKLAALHGTTALATAWNPAPDADAYVVATAPGAPVYVGGLFANIGGQARPWLAAIDRASGAATAWNPGANQYVNVLAVNSATVYAAGGFSVLGGQSRSRLGAVSASTGLATAFAPVPNSGVGVLTLDGTTVFAGGDFTTLGAEPRGSIAAYNATTGALLPWNPNVVGTVYALAAGGGIVYAGGSFTSAGGQTRNRLAAFDSTTAAVTTWDPNVNSTVRCLLLSGSRVYFGGQFTTVGGNTRTRGACVSTAGVLQSWNANATSTISALVTDGTYIYAGGGFTNIGGQPRSALAQLNATSGVATTWNPSVLGPVNALYMPDAATLYVGGNFTTVAGLSRPNLALINVTAGTVSTWAPAPNGIVTALAPSQFSGQIYVGGAFTTIGGAAISRLALVRPSRNSVSTWAPQPDDAVTALASSGSTLWIGGGFQNIGHLPKSNVSCAISLTAVDVPDESRAVVFALRVSPNPARGPIAIEYVLPEAAHVTIGVYDVGGRRMALAADGWQPSGAHRVDWRATRGTRLEAGVYFVRITAGGREAVRRVVVF